MEDHIEACHAFKKRECPICLKQFRWQRAYKRHCLEKTCKPENANKEDKVSAVVNLGKKMHLCVTCGKAFGCRSHMEDHTIALHSQEKMFKCPVCLKSFKWERSYRRHCQRKVCELKNINKEKVQAKEKKIHLCIACGKMFSNKGHMEDHMIAQHSLEKMFQCSVCFKSFKWKRAYRQHCQRKTCQPKKDKGILAMAGHSNEKETKLIIPEHEKDEILRQPDHENNELSGMGHNEKEEILRQPDHEKVEHENDDLSGMTDNEKDEISVLLQYDSSNDVC